MKNTKKQKIFLINTGGTIAMRSDIGGSSIPFGLEDVCKNISKSHKKYNDFSLEIIEFANLPSPHISFVDLLNIAKKIISLSASAKAFIITQGTDTLEESSYFLSLLLHEFLKEHPKKCVILTGSMRDQNDKKYDGIKNIKNALKIAMAETSTSLSVVFGDGVYNPSYVYKSSATKLNAFKGGKIGKVSKPLEIKWSKNAIRFYDNDLHILEKEIKLINATNLHIPKIAVITTYLGRTLDIDPLKYDILILEGSGAGNTSIEISRGLKDAYKKGVKIYVTSRIRDAAAMSTYGYEGGGAYLAQNGAILSQDTIKLRIYLIAQNIFRK